MRRATLLHEYALRAFGQLLLADQLIHLMTFPAIRPLKDAAWPLWRRVPRPRSLEADGINPWRPTVVRGDLRKVWEVGVDFGRSFLLVFALDL